MSKIAFFLKELKKILVVLGCVFFTLCNIFFIHKNINPNIQTWLLVELGFFLPILLICYVCKKNALQKEIFTIIIYGILLNVVIAIHLASYFNSADFEKKLAKEADGIDCCDHI